MPGGALLYYRKHRYDVYVLDIASRVLQQITDSPAIERLVYWSPTKNELLVGTFPAEEEYALDTGGPTIDTFYILGDSGKQLNLLGDSFRAWTAAWSPDSEEIVYSNYGELCIRDVGEQSDVGPLAEAFPAENYSVAFDEPAGWSASGHWLAFQLVERHQSPCYLTYILELSTNTVTEVDQQMYLGSPLYWSPKP